MLSAVYIPQVFFFFSSSGTKCLELTRRIKIHLDAISCQEDELVGVYTIAYLSWQYAMKQLVSVRHIEAISTH